MPFCSINFMILNNDMEVVLCYIINPFHQQQKNIWKKIKCSLMKVLRYLKTIFFRIKKK